MTMTDLLTTSAKFSLFVGLLCFNLSTISAIDIAEVITNDIEMDSNDGELIFSSVIFRHGDRNIDSVYPNDPYKDEKYWPEGFGALTNRGKMRQYKLGQYLRRRYDKLLGAKYSPKKIFVQSSDYDRTLMSAQTCLAGLFPPTNNEIWNSDILWQPIPVHTMPRKSDYLIAIENNCPKYTLLREKYTKKSKEYQRIFTEYADLLKYWSQMSGLKLKTTNNVYKLHNILTVEKEQNKRIPEWGEKALMDGVMEYIAAYDFVLWADTPELARFASGFLIKEIVEKFAQKVNATLNPDRVLWLYSAHDYTITNALNSFGLFRPEIHMPAYSSSIMIELFKTDQSEHYVQMFYRKSEEEHPLPLNIPGCGEKCPLDKFIELCKKFIPKGDIDAECRL